MLAFCCYSSAALAGGNSFVTLTLEIRHELRPTTPLTLIKHEFFIFLGEGCVWC